MKGDTVRHKYYFYTWNFLMVESGKNIFQSYFLEIWGGGGVEFPLIRVMEKPKFLHLGTCTSTRF